MAAMSASKATAWQQRNASWRQQQHHQQRKQ